MSEPAGAAEAVGSAEAAGAAAAALAAWGPTASLVPAIAPFPHDGGVRERLARNPFLMAPMAGVTDAAYRLMARAGGAALAYSEMVSATGICYGSEKTWELVDPDAAEPDLAVQLFGHDPAQMREAAAQVTDRLGARLALIDINMACPVPKVTRKGEGSALLDEPERAADIVRACREGAAGRVPVTVKIRRGRRMGDEVAPAFAQAMEQAGAAAVAVHGRFAEQLYHGEADWGCVARVAEATSVPVIGSGDVAGAEAACRMLDETSAAAVMVARGSYGNPWTFADACALRAGGVPPERTAADRVAAFRCHVRLLAATGAHLKRARSLAGWYLRGISGASRLRDEAMHAEALGDYLAVADEAEAILGAADGGR